MKLIELTCKNCKSKLNVNTDSKEVVCEFCGTSFLLDDEISHIKYDNAFEAGYEFEKGRMKAKEENYKKTTVNVNTIGSFTS